MGKSKRVKAKGGPQDGPEAEAQEDEETVTQGNFEDLQKSYEKKSVTDLLVKEATEVAENARGGFDGPVKTMEQPAMGILRQFCGNFEKWVEKNITEAGKYRSRYVYS